MDDRSREGFEPTHVRVVLDRIRPTVVVRRRPGETTPSQVESEPRHHPVTVAIAVDSRQPEPELAPSPSVAGVAAEVERPSAHEASNGGGRRPPLPPIERISVMPPPMPGKVRRVPVGSTIPITKLAAAMNLSPGEVASELVTRGFFEVAPRSTVSRAIARVAAEAFGWQVKEIADPKVPAPATLAPLTTTRRRKPQRSPKRSAKTATARRPAHKTTKPRKGAPSRRRPSASRRAA